MSGAALAHGPTDSGLDIPNLGESSSSGSSISWGDWASTEDVEASPRRVAHAEPISTLYPLVRLSADRALVRPLVVVVQAEGDSVVMSSPSLRVWGVGSDVYEALSDFESSLTGVYDSYRGLPQNELTQDAIEYLRLLRSYLEQ